MVSRGVGSGGSGGGRTRSAGFTSGALSLGSSQEISTSMVVRRFDVVGGVRARGGDFEATLKDYAGR